MLSYRCAGRLRIAQPPCSRQTKQKKKSTLAQKESKTLSIALPHPCSTYLLRRGLVQRHGASAATARGHDAQVRAPRSPGQGGHEVPGHSECCFWRREIAALCFFSSFSPTKSVLARCGGNRPQSRLSISLSLSLDLSLSLARQLRHDVAPRRSPGSATGASAPRPRPAAEDRHARALRSPQRPGIRRVHEGAAAGQRGLRVFGGRGRGELLRFQAARGLGGGLESGGEALG